MKDTEIITHLRANSTRAQNNALRFIYDHWFDDASKFLSKKGANMHDVEEIFQYSILGFNNKVSNPDFELTSSLKTFFISIIKNQHLKFLRFKKYVVFEEHHQHLIEKYDTKDQNIFQVKAQKILDQVKGKCKELLVLFYYEKLSMVQIALKLDYASEKVARSAKSRCLKTLKDKLKLNV